MRLSALQKAIDACNFCADTCDSCAAMCLHLRSDDSIDLCFQTAVDCAFVCRNASDCMSCKAPCWRKACQLAVRICRLTARQCRKHSARHFQTPLTLATPARPNANAWLLAGVQRPFALSVLVPRPPSAIPSDKCLFRASVEPPSFALGQTPPYRKSPSCLIVGAQKWAKAFPWFHPRSEQG